MAGRAPMVLGENSGTTFVRLLIVRKTDAPEFLLPEKLLAGQRYSN
jgi:hypothetical protein